MNVRTLPLLLTHDNIFFFIPKMEMFLFGMKPFYFHIAAFDVHYFLLANQPVLVVRGE